MSVYSQHALSGEALIEHARAQTIKRAHQQMRHGPDLTRTVKTWPRMQAEYTMRDKSGPEEMLAEGTKRVSGWSGFVREVFGRLYTGDKLRGTDVKPEHAWASQMHSMLDDLPEWQRMTQRCRGDSYSTSAATMGLSQKLTAQVPEHRRDAEEARRRFELLKEEWDDAKEAASQNGEPPPPPPPEMRQAKNDLDAARAEAEACAGNMDPSAMRQTMRAALAETNQHLDDIDSTLRAVGWGSQDAGPGDMSADAVKRDVAARLEQADRLREIMDLAGRLKNVMREAQAAKVRHGCSEITDIETGADVARLLPNEAALMRHPKGKLILFRKMLERGALQYHLEGKEPTGRGPVVVCIDDSGSMNGNRDVWAKALALALLEMARKQNRHYAFCTFSTQLTHTFVEETGKKSSPSVVIDALLAHRGGGTAFDPPLTWALEQVEKHDKLKDADVVFISDGDCRANKLDEHRRRLAKTGARVWGIAVGPSAVNSTGEGSMQSFCEKVYPVTELHIDSPGEQEQAAARGVLGL